MKTKVGPVEVVRDGSERPIGTLVAVRAQPAGRVYIGWAKCQRHKVIQQPKYDEKGVKLSDRVLVGDEFSGQEGIRIATERANELANQLSHEAFPDHLKMPPSLERRLKPFVKRIWSYFETLDIQVPPVRQVARKD